ncbi:hypothetical protein AAMO2058_001573600 [Amorphochlora amoebiformis]
MRLARAALWLVAVGAAAAASPAVSRNALMRSTHYRGAVGSLPRAFGPGIFRKKTGLSRLNMRQIARATIEEEEDVDQLYARALAADVLKEQGVDLEQLMSPMKAIRLYKEVQEKTKELETTETNEVRVLLETEIEEAQAKLSIEKRSVMREGLKRVFLIQSILSIIISGMLATNHFPNYDVPIAGQALGFWSIWLFTIPSLRARKPFEIEKQALNVAFVLTPLVNVLIPFLKKDPGLIWLGNVVTTALCYMWAYGTIDEDEAKKSGMKIEGIARWLDWGTGRERGAPKEVREEIERRRKEGQLEGEAE